MAYGRDLTTEADIAAAYERAKNSPPLPMAVSASYDRALDIIVLSLNNGRRLVIPREELQGLENATPAQIAQIEIYGGRDTCRPQLDLDHYLLHLMEGSYSTEKWRKQREQH